MLSFISGTVTFVIIPELAKNKVDLVTVMLSIFWGLTLINLKGIHISALINTICCAMGTIFPLLLLILLGSVWILSGYPHQIQFNTDSLIPPLNQSTSWI